MSVRPALPITLRDDPATGLPCCPSVADAARLSPAASEALHAYLDEQLAGYLETLPGEGTAHSGSIVATQDRLKGHFGRVGRGVFVAPNLGVHYPDAPPFAPDLLAVLDVPLHERRRWQVDVEGRGVDFVLEVLVDGDKKKDLVDNVEFYASLGIPEYFVHVVRDQTVKAWRLETPDARRYVRVVPQFGRLPSRVLDLEWAVLEGQLRCWRNGAELPLTTELVTLLGRQLAEKEAQLEEKIALVDDAERARADLLRRGVLRTLKLRGLTPTPAELAEIADCADLDRLTAWDERVEDTPTVSALLG